jgi:saccharopine dehydrogenase (NAD+, L-lysine forming)
MSPTTIHLRSETKPLERRSPRMFSHYCSLGYETNETVSPASAKALVQAGFLLRVERCRDRIYGDEEFEAAGAEMVSAGSWVDAPHQHIILGLKELSEGDSPLPHTYIHFQHCFKKQEGWATSLSRFVRGGGMLYDLEFLTGEDGRRVAAFGYWAGYAGAALALIAWAHQLLHPGIAQGPAPRFDSAPALADHVKSIIETSIDTNGGQRPRIIIIGALGRCGKGAVDFCLGIGIPREYILEWDMEETSRGGPFPEVVASDIFINCVYLGPKRIAPFVTFDSLTTPERRLRVICDVSCDPNSENNPIPVYSGYSSFDSPTVPISRKLDGPELRVVAIDHLPTLVAREASDEFSHLLLPSLLTLDRRESEGVWVRAERTFAEKVRELPGDCSSV